MDFDRKRLVTGSLDRLILVYDVLSLKFLGKLEGHKVREIFIWFKIKRVLLKLQALETGWNTLCSVVSEQTLFGIVGFIGDNLEYGHF